MALDINREIAATRNSKMDVNQYVSMALRKIQDELNSLSTASAAVTPAANAVAPTATTPASVPSSTPLFVGGNAITISGTYPDLNIAADAATTTAKGVVKLDAVRASHRRNAARQATHAWWQDSRLDGCLCHAADRAYHLLRRVATLYGAARAHAACVPRSLMAALL